MMNAMDDDFDLDDHDLTLRRWGDSRARLLVTGLVQTLSLAFVWEHLSDAWQIARSVSFTKEIPDDWYF